MSDLAVTLTVAQLRDLVNSAVVEAIERREQAGAPRESLTYEQAGEILGVGADTVRKRYVRHEGLPMCDLGGGVHRILLADLRAWLRSRRTGAPAADGLRAVK